VASGLGEGREWRESVSTRTEMGEGIVVGVVVVVIVVAVVCEGESCSMELSLGLLAQELPFEESISLPVFLPANIVLEFVALSTISPWTWALVELPSWTV